MKLLTTKEAAALLRMSESNLHRLACERRGPAFIQYKARGPRFYREQDLDAFIASCTVRSLDTPEARPETESPTKTARRVGRPRTRNAQQKNPPGAAGRQR